ncbi:uncharacterized protein N0V89_000081 [Didymosphaeria variabile]|uniref:NmrA-like domain-containing protein n=1 Tax=Didymosphaeria variabile TaxID=1932322 RepID=A0A9W9CFI1_9PLEO|nr:uncharacterized protein N0V89_000081 [Didymosphaeria variabile]KAJ4359526.1 hypothetical protein N0V89_000081 [Didymosphaeria variabile]
MLGGALISHLLSLLPASNPTTSSPNPHPNLPSALKLVQAGISVVHADLEDAASLETALKDVHAVFLVTDFWSCASPGALREISQAKRVLDILSRSSSLEHLIYSSLPSIRSASKGKYSAVVHFDGKADVVSWLQSTHDDLWGKTTVLWVGTYMQLWQQFRDVFAPQKMVEEGREVWIQSSVFYAGTKLPLVDVRDVGKAAFTILKEGRG